MTEEEKEKQFDAYIEATEKAFERWLDKNNNLLDISVKEALGNAFFDAREDLIKKITKQEETLKLIKQKMKDLQDELCRGVAPIRQTISKDTAIDTTSCHILLDNADGNLYEIKYPDIKTDENFFTTLQDIDDYLAFITQKKDFYCILVDNQGLEGKIYSHGSYSNDTNWELYGVTRGYA